MNKVIWRDSEWWLDHADMYWKERDAGRRRFCKIMARIMRLLWK